MTLRRGLLALSLVAFAARAAADPSQSAPPQSSAAPATRAATADETPVDPLAIAFDTSPDHDAVDAAGPKLVKYVIDFVPTAGAAGKSHTLDLGKPKPVDGSISVPLNKVLEPGTYMAHVRSIGRGLGTTTVTVGPFVITEKIGKTKADIDKELRAADPPPDKRTKKPKEKAPQPKNPPTKPPQTQPPPAPPQTESGTPGNEGKDGKDNAKPAKKGFWRKAYEKVVGDPMAPS